MKRLLRNRRGVLYVYAIFIVGLFALPVVWFICHTLFWSVQPVCVALAEDLGTNTTEFYQVDTFMQAFDNWVHVLALFALAIFGFVYSQRRGQRV